MAEVLPGWKPLEGGRRYLSPSGQNVSRRQYLNAIAQRWGWRNYSEFQRANSLGTLEGQRRLAAARVYARKTGLSMSVIWKIDSDFNRRYVAAKAEGFSGRLPNSATARFLEMTTRRAVGAAYMVGETPDEERLYE